MRYLIATGGTGGHIYPALALAEAIQKNEPSSTIVFIGDERRMESQVIPAANFKFIGLKLSGMNGGIVNKIKSLSLMMKSYRICINLLRQERPDVVIGFGNYISVPVILAAHRLKIVTMIHEQNSYAGKANRFLARHVDAVVGCYRENLTQFPKEKTQILGNPQASKAAETRKLPLLVEELGLDASNPLVVVVMGSLGSSSVNQIMKCALSQMKDKPYQTLYVTGKKHYDDFVRDTTFAKNVKVVPYIDGIQVMANADLCVVRGGATTASEICAMGMPSIIIPSPYVPNNHQYYNAKALQDVNAAVLIEEKELSTEKIIGQIDEIMSSNIRRSEMSKNALKCAQSDASTQMLKWMKKLKDEKDARFKK